MLLVKAAMKRCIERASYRLPSINMKAILPHPSMVFDHQQTKSTAHIPTK
jgi:hypothetical protein